MRVLITKPDSLGDQILVSGLVQRLAEAHSKARILWHVRPGMEAIAGLIPGAQTFTPDTTNSPAVERQRLEGQFSTSAIVLVPYPLNPFADWQASYGTYLEWWRSFLQASPWDLALAPAPNRNWVADATAYLSQAPTRLGFAPNAARQAVINDAARLVPPEAPIFTEELAPSFEIPETVQLEALFRRVVGLQDHPLQTAPRLQIPALARTRADALLPSDGRPLAVLVPGVGQERRRAWPIDKFLAVADRLRAAGHAIRWLQGPSDAAYFEPFSGALRSEILEVPAGDLTRAAALFSRADLILCNDTAASHLASALGRRAVAVYGAGQGGRFHPAFGAVKVVQGDVPCAGCQWHCIFERFPCVQDLPVEAVWDAVQTLLGNQPADAVPVPIPLPINAAADPARELQRRWQETILALDWDRWARLQIVHDLLARTRVQEAELAELRKQAAAAERPAEAQSTLPAPRNAPVPPPSFSRREVMRFPRWLWRRLLGKKPKE